MQEIILGVLSWVGIILLVLLIVALILILLVLVYPITYRISALKDESDLQITAKAKWLFGLLSIHYGYPDPGKIIARFLGVKLYDSSVKPTDKTKVKTQKSNQKRDTAIVNDTDNAKDGSITNDNDVMEEDKTTETASDETHPKNFFYTFQSICDKIKMIWENITYYISLLQEENTRALFAHVCMRFGNIFKYIYPKRVEANIIAGTGSPDTTGYLYGIYCMLFPALGPKISVQPDFERAILKLHLRATGHVTVAVLIINVFQLTFDKKLHLFLKDFKAAPKVGNKTEDVSNG